MFEIAQYCQKLCESAQLPSVYKSVIEQLEDQWSVCESAKFLFLALADNIRVNAEHLTYAREEYDKIFGYRDLEIDLCTGNRNRIREIFLSASNVLQQTPDWLNVKSYVILVELHQKHKRLSGDKFSEEVKKILHTRPSGVNKLIAALCLDNLSDEQMTTQVDLSRILNRELELNMLFSSDSDVLAKAMNRRAEVVNLVVRLIGEEIERNCRTETIENVAKWTSKILICKEFLQHDAFLRKLDNLFHEGTFAQSEFMNYLTVFLNLGQKRKTQAT